MSETDLSPAHAKRSVSRPQATTGEAFKQNNEEEILLKIIRLRKDRGWTKRELSRRMGSKQAVLSRMETDSGHLMLQTILRFAEALEVDPALLLGVTCNAVDPEWERFQALSFERKRYVSRLVDELFRLEQLEKTQTQAGVHPEESDDSEKAS